MSKTFSMPGWRMGFAVGNERLLAALTRVKSYLDYGAYTPIQVAAAAALNGPEDCIVEMRAIYKARRDVMVESFAASGWTVPAPAASMFAWVPIPERFRHMGSLEFSKLLIERADVAVAPGIGFGEHGDDHVRLALVENEQRIRQAARGIKRFFDAADARLHNVVPLKQVGLTAPPDAPPWSRPAATSSPRLLGAARRRHGLHRGRHLDRMRRAGLSLAGQPLAGPRAHRLQGLPRRARPARRRPGGASSPWTTSTPAPAGPWPPGRGALGGGRPRRAVVTQNIDGLHAAAGRAGDELVELHGNGTYARCLGCGTRYELAPIGPGSSATGRCRTAPAAASSNRPASPSARRSTRRPLRRAVAAAARLRPLRRAGLDPAGAPGRALPRTRVAQRRPARHREPRADAARRRWRTSSSAPTSATCWTRCDRRPRPGPPHPQHTFHNLVRRGAISPLTGFARC